MAPVKRREWRSWRDVCTLFCHPRQLSRCYRLITPLRDQTLTQRWNKGGSAYAVDPHGAMSESRVYIQHTAACPRTTRAMNGRISSERAAGKSFETARACRCCGGCKDWCMSWPAGGKCTRPAMASHTVLARERQASRRGHMFQAWRLDGESSPLHTRRDGVAPRVALLWYPFGPCARSLCTMRFCGVHDP